MSHTPEPWMVKDDPLSDFIDIECAGGTLARIPRGAMSPLANANVMAAAPALLASAEYFAEIGREIVQQLRDEGCDGGAIDLAAALRESRAAIAKAEGK